MPCKEPSKSWFSATIKCLVDEKVNEKPSNVIVMTREDCSTLGSGWTNYQPMNGRVPLAAGTGKDDREESKAFSIGDIGGEYRHQLTVSEMPKHTHAYKDKYFNNRKYEDKKRGDDDDKEREYNIDTRRTIDSDEGNQPHNNMPPYSVVNFCWQG